MSKFQEDAIVGPSPYFSKFLKKGGVSDFFHKREGLVKGGGILKRGGVSRIFILTNPFQCYLSLSICCVCVCVCVCVLCIYTISVSIICVSHKEPSLIASNQQI